MNTTVRPRDIVLSMWRAFEADHDLAVLDRYFAPGYQRFVGRSPAVDLKGWKATLQSLYTAFPDFHTAIDVVVAEGDWVTYRWTATARHLGDYLGVPSTGKFIEAVGISMIRFEDGRIREERSSWNKVDVLHQLGVLPISPL
ncbi:ester cyclase [Streptomyces sp. NPDC048282]|uniref:ester cyclase n=1 Tax=Streptomyces sp. NPDC048282 TaxID=3365528 RepID=UPI0037200A4C